MEGEHDPPCYSARLGSLTICAEAAGNSKRIRSGQPSSDRNLDAGVMFSGTS